MKAISPLRCEVSFNGSLGLVQFVLADYTGNRMLDCVFCQIIEGKLPAIFVFKSADVVAFKPKSSAAPVQVLIVPTKHIKSLAGVIETDKDVLGRIQIAASKLAKKLGIKKAFRLLAASGASAGQSVFHLHYHLIGGWEGKSPKMETEPGGLRR